MAAKKPRSLPPRVTQCVVKGRDYYYYRASRLERVRLFGRPYDRDGFPEAAWWSAYYAVAHAYDGNDTGVTVADLLQRYICSERWSNLSPLTQRQWRTHILLIKERWSSSPADKLSGRAIYELRDEFAQTPAKANNLMRCLSAILGWAAGQGLMKSNLCRRCPKLLIRSERTYATWSRDDLALLESVAPTDVWHVAAMVLWTAQPLEAILTLRWSDVGQSELHFRIPRDFEMPVSPGTRQILDRRVRNSPRVFVTERQRAWTKASYRRAWDILMHDSRLKSLRQKRLVFHGLKKTAIMSMVNSGCTRAEVAAVTGLSWKTLDPHFTAHEQRALARSAMARWAD